MSTEEIVTKNNKAILRRLTDRIRISEVYDFNPKLNPLNEVYNKKIKQL